MRSAGFDEDRQYESIIRICNFLNVNQHRFSKAAHFSHLLGIETSQLLSFKFLSQLFRLPFYVCFGFLLLFYGQCAHIDIHRPEIYARDGIKVCIDGLSC